MHIQYTISEAKNRLPAIIHEVEKGPLVKLTRRGRPVAILLSIKEYEKLNRKQGGFWNGLIAFRESVSLNDLYDDDFEVLRDDSPGRPVDLL
ncbi:MAG: type II toxin-antitoxin system Phd/YefM family antitoxin [Desulfatitalea sp.]|nr:type II toxin-antitoxin system Phd/YefM family antitoxin [Desulfatitalea sp.]NNJ99233.1 type II toxin-antitoxin system Phd/YefM family antitoxin [Desulfatitalea sp.]